MLYAQPVLFIKSEPRHLDLLVRTHPLPAHTFVPYSTIYTPSSTMELTWSLDYCLACDKQTSGGAYCSQSCRLADLETSSTWAGPSSPTNTFTPSSASDTHRGSGFYLSPAINFQAYKTSTTQARTQPTLQSSYFSTNYTFQPASTKSLTPSTSRSSLSSNASDSSQHSQLSEQIHNELRAYSNSFDTTRNWRRRTWS